MGSSIEARLQKLENLAGVTKQVEVIVKDGSMSEQELGRIVEELHKKGVKHVVEIHYRKLHGEQS